MAVDARTSPTLPVTTDGDVRSASARDRLSALFPDPATPRPSWWYRRRKLLVTVVVIALVASGLLAADAFGASDPAYVTATVATRNVDAFLTGVGSVEPVSQASVAFPAAGTVASVAVKTGDFVTVGQTLATLDPQALTETLHEKQATLAQAQLTLQKALAGESVGGVGGATSGSGTGSGGGSGSGSGGSTGNRVGLTAMSMPRSGSASVAAAQQAVVAAQQKVDAAINTSTQALDAATTVSAAAGVGSSTPTPPTSDTLTACQTATKAVLDAQAAVSRAQQELAQASSALDSLLTTAAASGAGAGTGSSSGGSSSSGSGTGHTGSGATSTAPSAADLAAYQKAVDAAAAGVAVAEQAIAQATIVSPIPGTVQAVNLEVGDTVTAGSTTATIVVVGAGGFEVTTTVSVDKVTSVKVGQPATFLPDGAKRALTGSVTAISIAPDATATTTSYRVVIGLSDPDAKLNNGSTGSVSIVTKSSRAVLAVPTSAVTTVGTRHTVTVLDGSTTKPTLVQVGVVGDTWTETTGGVTAGQKVVLANLAEPLPGSATDSSSSSSNTNQPGQLPAGGLRGGFRFGGPPGQ